MRKTNSISVCALLASGLFLSSSLTFAAAEQDLVAGAAPNSKLHGNLSQLLLGNSGLQSSGEEERLALNNTGLALEALPPLVDEGYVVIDAVARNNSERLEAELLSLGMQNISRFGRIVSGQFPVGRLAELERLTALQFASNTLAVKDRGVVNSQGDRAMNADVARDVHNVNGSGVKIGVLSDSYDCLGGASSGVATGDLPAGLTVLKEANCNQRTYTDEGRAMLEIVHDVAPESSLLFHTANGGQAAFANGIVELARAGSKVIIDDIKYLAEPFFQDGIIAQAVDQVHQQHDVTYFSSAGNGGRNAYASEFRDMGSFMNFATWDRQVDICLEVEVKPGRVVIPVLQWDQPFFSVTGGNGAASDMSMILLHGCNPSRRITMTAVNNIGADPIEMAFIRNPTEQNLTLGIMVRRLAGPVPGRIKLVTTGGTITDFNKTQTGSTYGHAIARGAMGVGASVYKNARPYVDNAIINHYSSAGGAEILFDANGQRLAQPEIRLQPAIVGPDGVDTTFFGSPYDDNNYPNFFGTSASAPHVGAVAALMRAHNPEASANEVYSALTRTADDMDDPFTKNHVDVGYDTGTGYGFVNAEAAIAAISPVVPLVEAYCDGRLATIVGTEGVDNLVGTAGDDVIVALGGNDSIAGRGGNDVICGGDGNDNIYTGAGDDLLFGGSGNDYIDAGAGNNVAHGGDGNDRLIGGWDDDTFNGGAGRDLLMGREGDDVLMGDEGYDVAFGGEGQDTCDAETLIQCE